MARSSTIAPALSRWRPRQTRVQFADQLEPMLATSASALPADVGTWACEYKWDGVRAIFYWDGRHARLLSRNQLDMTARYPELAHLGKGLGKKPAILDGEIVALEPGTARPSFPRLQHRMHVENPNAALCDSIPIYFILFDVLRLGGKSLIEKSYSERRLLLESLALSGQAWQLSPSFPGSNTEAMLDSARRQGLEGVVLKRLKSTYEPGRRSRDWLKLKVVHGQEFVIGGWVPEGGNTAGQRVGALLLGYYDANSKLQYAGSVGSGFTADTHALLHAKLRRLKSLRTPFAGPAPKRDAIFVKPELVADIEFRRWPADGYIQQAAFKGLRFDKQPDQVVREDLSFENTK